MCSVFSRYGIHSVPSLLIVNQTTRIRHHGSKDVQSLVSFYKITTGIAYPKSSSLVCIQIFVIVLSVGNTFFFSFLNIFIYFRSRSSSRYSWRNTSPWGSLSGLGWSISERNLVERTLPPTFPSICSLESISVFLSRICVRSVSTMGCLHSSSESGDFGGVEAAS